MADNRGNKNIIRDNHGTINITNSHDSEMLKKMIEQNNAFTEMAMHFTKTMDSICTKTIEMIGKKRKPK
jgi:hypothetical protein